METAFCRGKADSVLFPRVHHKKEYRLFFYCLKIPAGKQYRPAAEFRQIRQGNFPV